MAQGVQLPGNAQSEPGIPTSFLPLIWEDITTVNTKPLRPGIGDNEAYWLDGWMPLGPSNLRILPGTGATLYSAAAGLSIVWFQFFNIFDTEYAVVLLSNGSMIQVDITTGVTTTIGGAGMISSPSTVMGFSQWGSQYLILAKDQSNGYWLWDGSLLYTAGTIGPQINIDNAGINYTSAPSLLIYTTGSGTGAAANAIVTDGSVTQAIVTNPGSGFTVDDFVAINVTGGGSDDQALGSPVVNPSTGGITGVVIGNGGNKYTSRASVVFTPVDGNGQNAVASLAIQNGTIVAISMLNEGFGYTQPPTVTITDPGIPGSPGIPGGSGFTGTAEVGYGQIVNVNMVSGGSGYTTAPIVQIIGDGTGATATATLSGGQVVGVLFTNNGVGYTKALVVFQGGNNAANLTPFLMPFGVSGTTVETYQGRVWVSNGGATSQSPPKNRTLFSAPQSPVDFGNGGGAFQSFDSFLRVGYHSLKQANGFLYLIGDSSMNYVSGVQTTNSVSASVPATPITTFSNQNVDPQIGSSWPSSVQVFSRNIVMANAIGIFASTGGAVQKISTPFDGFYGSQADTIQALTFDASSAVATIFGTSVYMLLLPVTDPYTGAVVNKLLMWDGRRLWTSQQDQTLAYIATQELNSVMNAWGTDRTNLFPLFQTPSTGFTKVVQSKLFANPAYFVTKTARSLSGIFFSFELDSNISIFIDNETGVGNAGNAASTVQPSPSGQWFNNNGDLGSWVNNNGDQGFWGVAGLDVFGPLAVGQNGRLLGFTVQTTASNVALLSLMLSEQTFATNL